MIQPLARLVLILILAPVITGLVATRAEAQLAFDAQPGPIKLGPTWLVTEDQGIRSGGNLLYSFERFDLPTNEAALFRPNDPADVSVERLISRVTGGAASMIDGRIVSDYRGATFFLINPHGLVFGPGAELGISGSFYASTAQTLHFGSESLATGDATDLPLLELPALSAFGFEQGPVKPIRILGSELIVPREIGLIGGNIEIAGGEEHLIRARADGNIWLASVAGVGEVALPDGALGPAISTNIADLGTITLRNGAALSSSGVDRADGAGAQLSGSGFVSILAGTLDVSDSQIRAESAGNLDGRGIFVEADHIALRQLSSETGLFARKITDPLIPPGPGRAGDIALSGKTLSLTGGARISASTRDAGRGGQITLDDFRSIEVMGQDADGNRSAIFINTTGDGDAGSLTLRSEELTLQDSGALVSQTSEGTGGAGEIRVDVDRLTVLGNGRIDASTRGAGDGGAIRITASESILLSGFVDEEEFSGITSLSQPEASGSAGEIVIDAPEIVLEDGARISAGSEGTGVANQVAVGFKSDSPEVPGKLQTLELRDGSVISVAAKGESDAGEIRINAKTLVQLEDSRISASVKGGRGGNVDIDPEFVIIRNSQIIATADQGDGGNISITARNFLASESEISASSNFGVSGSVEINSPNTTISGDLARLTEAPLDPAALLREHCAARQPGAASSFVERGVAGAPVSFRAPQLAHYPARPELNEIVRLAKSGLLTPALQRADILLQSVEPPFEKAPALALRGQLRLRAGQLPAATRDFEQALRTASASLAQQIHLDQAVLALAALKPEEAAQQLRAVRANSDTPAETRLRARLNLAQLDAGENPERPGPDPELMSAVLQRLSEAHEPGAVSLGLALGRLGMDLEPTAEGDAEVAELLDRSARRARALGETELEAHGWNLLAELYARTGLDRDALLLARRGLIRTQGKGSLYLRYRLDARLGQLLARQGETERAVRTLERAASGLFQLRLRAAQRSSPAVFEPQLAGEDVLLDLADALLVRAKNATTLEAQQRDLATVRSVLEDFNAVEIQNFFQDECVTQQRVVTPGNLPGAFVVYPVMLRERTELIVSYEGTTSLVTVPIGRAEMIARLRTLRRNLQMSWNRSYRAAATDLYDWLIRPLEAQLGELENPTLVLVPLGDLRGIPVAALYDSRTESFAIEKWPIAIAPGLQLTDPRPISVENAKSLKAGLTVEVQGFPPLPQVENELDELDALFAGATLMNEEFRTPALASELAKTAYDIVHVASHAEFGTSLDEAYLVTYDGRLAMDRLADLVATTRFRDQPLELLTLSACQTAASSDRSALGLAGVSIRAGARSTLATLWIVNDAASARLVTQFYRELAQPNRSRAEALRRAQLALVQDPALGHPAYWAPFVLIGSWL